MHPGKPTWPDLVPAGTECLTGCFLKSPSTEANTLAGMFFAGDSSAQGDGERRGVEEHDGHGGGVDGEAEEDADGAKAVGAGFGVPADDDGGECLGEFRLHASSENPFYGKDTDKYPKAGAQDQGHGGDDKNLGMGICASDQPAGEAGGRYGDGSKTDHDLGALVEDVQLALEKAEKKCFLPGEGFEQILGFFEGCLRDFHISHDAVNDAWGCQWTALDSILSPSKWK